MSRHWLHFSVSGCRIPVVGHRKWRISAINPSLSRPIVDSRSRTVNHRPKPPNPKRVNAKQLSRLSSVRQEAKPNELIFLIFSFLGVRKRRFFTRCMCQVRSAFYRPKERAEGGPGRPGSALIWKKSSLRRKLECGLESIGCLERSSRLHPWRIFPPAQRRPHGIREAVVIELA